MRLMKMSTLKNLLVLTTFQGKFICLGMNADFVSLLPPLTTYFGHQPFKSACKGSRFGILPLQLCPGSKYKKCHGN